MTLAGERTAFNGAEPHAVLTAPRAVEPLTGLKRTAFNGAEAHSGDNGRRGRIITHIMASSR
jgi:hypothetical protein